jgi:hypothetical protein
MEDIGTVRHGQSAEKSLRKPYQVPQLVNLGQIQSLVQGADSPGNDGPINATDCAVS